MVSPVGFTLRGVQEWNAAVEARRAEVRASDPDPSLRRLRAPKTQHERYSCFYVTDFSNAS
jgi:hypothetical protein